MGDQTSEIEDLERVFSDTTAKPIKISYAAICYVTKNFAQVIGDGGFGEVYLGALQNGMVAVKKLFKTKDFSNKQFSNEVACLTKAHHRNIVRFLGYCADTQGIFMEFDGNLKMIEEPRMLLCFEYVPNGNLHHYLTGRYYVLMGANMEPKITDFGVSRSLDQGQRTVETKFYFGTQGYIAPEFIDDKKYSSKSDIYSLGIIMINVLTGRAGGIIDKWHETIDAGCPHIKRCIEIAQICVNKDPHARPTTGEIINWLNEAETELEKDPPIINEPRYDPDSSLYKVEQTFRSLPALNLQEHSREHNNKPGELPYHLLYSITGNFSNEQLIGKGAFGSVYKGILRQRDVVVKRLFITMDSDDRKIYDNEIRTSRLAQHKNIVQLLGYCSYTGEEEVEYQGKFVMADRQEKLLCFEYLSSGSLIYYVSDASCGLEWRARYKIIKGICEGLQYLHVKNIVHLDLKPENILLDFNMNPKIYDFGISRCFDKNQSQMITQSESGTMEYMAPEFINTRTVSFKCDIYSLGVVITEILTGHKPYGETKNVLEEWKNRLETSSPDTLSLEQVRVCANISMACTNPDPKMRPDMQDIIKVLVKTETDGAGAVEHQD